MKNIKYITLVLGIFLFIVSCGSNEPRAFNPSDDATITGMYIQRNKKTLEASNAVFFVDQENNLITNLDSLPYGTKIDSLYLGFTFQSSVGFTMNDTASEESNFRGNQGVTSRPYNLTKPTTVLNIATDGKSKKKYTIKVNVHTVEPYLHVWEKLKSEVVPNASENQKAILFNDVFHYFFGDDTGYTVYTSTDAKTWTKSGRTTGLLPKIELKNMQVFNSTIYLLNENIIYSSVDGMNWVAKSVKGASDYKYSKLLFIFKNKIWATAINTNDATIRIVSSNDGINWNFAGKRVFGDNFPIDDFAATSYKPAVGREKIIVVGGKTEQGKILSSVWAAENILGTDTLNWINLQRPNKLLNNISNASIGYYGNKLMLIGGEIFGKIMPDSVQLLQSLNEGLTWKKPNKKHIKLPTDFIKRKNTSFIEDRRNNTLYLIGGQTVTKTLSDSWKIKVNFYNFEDYKTNQGKY